MDWSRAVAVKAFYRRRNSLVAAQRKFGVIIRCPSPGRVSSALAAPELAELVIFGVEIYLDDCFCQKKKFTRTVSFYFFFSYLDDDSDAHLEIVQRKNNHYPSCNYLDEICKWFISEFNPERFINIVLIKHVFPT